MSGVDSDLLRDMKRYLRRRSSAGISSIFRIEDGERRGESGSGEEEIMVRTSPEDGVAPRYDDTPERVLEEGFSRDTRLPAQESLFQAAGPQSEAPEGKDLASLERIVSECTRCALSETRTKTVFGRGDPESAIVFVGEAPGKDEDLQGEPFVGRAGKLLDKILASIGFDREDVYIANILKCRPPGNRDPKEDEVAACEAFLARQLELIKPRLICALGRIAGQNLLGTKASLKVLRQGIHYYNGIRVVVTYHPAALLRNPQFKRPAWEDMKMLRRLYDGYSSGG